MLPIIIALGSAMIWAESDAVEQPDSISAQIALSNFSLGIKSVLQKSH